MNNLLFHMLYTENFLLRNFVFVSFLKQFKSITLRVFVSLFYCNENHTYN